MHRGPSRTLTPCASPMRRPGKVLRGAACKAEEQMAFTTNALKKEVATALTNRKRAIEQRAPKQQW